MDQRTAAVANKVQNSLRQQRQSAARANKAQRNTSVSGHARRSSQHTTAGTHAAAHTAATTRMAFATDRDGDKGTTPGASACPALAVRTRLRGNAVFVHLKPHSPAAKKTSKRNRTVALRKVYMKKRHHIEQCHPEQRRELSKANGSDNLLRVLQRRPKSSAGWRYDKCAAGIPQEQISQASARKLRQAQWEHARDKHGATDRNLWSREQKGRPSATPANRAAQSNRQRAAGLAGALLRVQNNQGGHSQCLPSTFP